ncbi:DUF342 domain-containing protein [Halobacillus litoralis]|uniref:DUF342 domain-containing protein n=1 Tax=Halobacillus litoralis TaxID=45668 RepID=UPI00248F7DF8|nr:FapA family protein [Halobacillus litoralis]
MQQEEYKVIVSPDKMEAVIHFSSVDSVTEQVLSDLLKGEGITFGIKEEVIRMLVEEPPLTEVEVLVAKGIEPVDGENGRIVFDKPMTMEVDQEEKASFRDIIAIPSVSKGDRIARIEPHTSGVPGKNVFGEAVQQKPGKTPNLRAGKNTTYDEKEAGFYAEIDGQLSYKDRAIQVQPLFEVRGDLDLHTGNLDFIGSIAIRGNVPTGYKVKAAGDITVYGMVEAAELSAGGSVHISDGVSGLGKARITAGEDVRIGYINQAVVEAGQDLFVENSALHSQCVAHRSVYCQKGNIIGGTTSAGNRVEAQSIGNRMHTPTGIYIGVNKKVEEKQMKLNQTLKAKMEQKEKLVQIGKSLERKRLKQGELSAKERITSLRQRSSLENNEEEIYELAEQMKSMNSSIGDLDDAYLKAVKNIHAFTNVGFGKYVLRVDVDHTDVHMILDSGEIVIKANR